MLKKAFPSKNNIRDNINIFAYKTIVLAEGLKGTIEFAGCFRCYDNKRGGSWQWAPRVAAAAVRVRRVACTLLHRM